MTAASRAKLPSNPHGVVLWEGASLLNGAPIVMVATGIDGGSTNVKTSGMTQVWVLCRDVPPGEARRSGADEAVCGTCPQRPFGGWGSCFVNVAWGPTQVWKAYGRGLYPKAKPSDLRLISQRPVRFGAYGDPLGAPIEVWRSVLPEKPRDATGYTHSWRASWADPYKHFLMASVETIQDALEARARGWRCFLVLPQGAPIPDGFRECPADRLMKEDAGACIRCGACNGTRGVGRPDIAIHAHGPSGRTFSPDRSRKPSVPLPERHRVYEAFVRMDRGLHTDMKAHCEARGESMKQWVAITVRARIEQERREGQTISRSQSLSCAGRGSG